MEFEDLEDAIMSDFNEWLTERYTTFERVDLISRFSTSAITEITEPDSAYELANTRDMIAECIYERLDGETKSNMIQTCKAWSHWLLQKNDNSTKFFEEYISKIQYRHVAVDGGDLYMTYRDGVKIFENFIKDIVPAGYYEWEEENLKNEIEDMRLAYAVYEGEQLN